MVKYECDRCGKKLATEIKEGTKVTLYSVKSTEQGKLGLLTFVIDVTILWSS